MLVAHLASQASLSASLSRALRPRDCRKRKRPLESVIGSLFYFYIESEDDSILTVRFESGTRALLLLLLLVRPQPPPTNLASTPLFLSLSERNTSGDDGTNASNAINNINFQTITKITSKKTNQNTREPNPCVRAAVLWFSFATP